MTACFYDMRGGMVGLDKHLYWELVKGVGPAGILIGKPSDTRHLVAHMHSDPNNGKNTPTVTSEGNPMIKKDFSLKYVGHVPLTLKLPSVLEAGWLAGIIIRSKSEPIMYMPSVTGEGTSLACCVHAMVGANKNCEGYGVVINPNSVVTSPSLADFAQVLAGMLLNKALDWVVGKVIGTVFPALKFPVPNDDGSFTEIPNPIAEVLKWTFDEFVKKDHIDPVIDDWSQDVAEWVDGL